MDTEKIYKEVRFFRLLSECFFRDIGGFLQILQPIPQATPEEKRGVEEEERKGTGTVRNRGGEENGTRGIGTGRKRNGKNREEEKQGKVKIEKERIQKS